MATFLDRHSDADKAAMKALLMPLVAASRSRDFVDVAAARVQIAAFMQALSDCPRAIVQEAVAAMVSRGVVWMPKPGELKAECARIVGFKRAAVFKEITGSCRLQADGRCNASFFMEDEAGRSRRCDCWTDAQRAMDRIGQPIALPPAQPELRESEIW